MFSKKLIRTRMTTRRRLTVNSWFTEQRAFFILPIGGVQRRVLRPPFFVMHHKILDSLGADIESTRNHIHDLPEERSMKKSGGFYGTRKQEKIFIKAKAQSGED